MSHFIFKAKRPTGEVYNSERDAADRFELYRLLREGGDEIVSLEERGRISISWNIFTSLGSVLSSVKMIDKINFARNLGSMLEAGLSLSRALSVLERQARNQKFKKILDNIISDINQGSTFSSALEKYPKVFSQLFISMVHAGEQSGTLSDSLKIVSIQMNNMFTLERRVRGALIYPSVIVGLMIIVGILMFVFVVPTLMATFTELKVELPWMTQVVLDISTAMRDNGIFYIILFLLIVGGLYMWSKTMIGKKILHMLIIKLPIVGPLVQEVNTARTARTLSSLLGAGVDVVESVNITAAVVQNVHFKDVLVRAAEAIKKGDLMSKIFNENTKLYPIFLGEMMSVGEETGKTKDMLLGVAKYYEEDVEQRTKDMSTIIEPVLIIFIGGAVAFFAVAMITPMYSLVNVI